MSPEMINEFIKHSRPLTGHWESFGYGYGEYYPLDTDNRCTPLEQILGRVIYHSLPAMDALPQIPLYILQALTKEDPHSFVILHGSQLYSKLTHPMYLGRHLQESHGNFMNDLDIAVFSSLPTPQVNQLVKQGVSIVAEKDKQKMLNYRVRDDYAQRIYTETDPSSLDAPAYIRVRYKYEPLVKPKCYTAYEIHHIDASPSEWETRFWSLYLQFYSNLLGNGGLLIHLDKSGNPQYDIYAPFPRSGGTNHRVFLSIPEHVQTHPEWSGPKAARLALYTAQVSKVSGIPANIHPPHAFRVRESLQGLSPNSEIDAKTARRLKSSQAQAKEIHQEAIFNYFVTLLGLYL